MDDGSADPHADAPTVTAGADLADATAAVVLCHGRGAQARGILGLARTVDADEVAFLAPQATRNTWYPNSFMDAIESNQPWLDSALAVVDRTVEHVESAGIPTDRIALGGFSQGACLTSEYAVRNPRPYGGVVVLSGGLVGPAGTTWDTDGSFEGMPVFVGCSDADPHIPQERVEETTATFEAMDADVDERFYEGMGHRINADEQDAVGELIAGLVEH